MKFGLVLLLMFTSVSAFSADQPVFRAVAEAKYMGDYSVTASDAQTPFSFKHPINRIVVNDQDNLVKRYANRLSEFTIQAMAVEQYHAEIHFYAEEGEDSEYLNCYVLFEKPLRAGSWELKNVYECSKSN